MSACVLPPAASGVPTIGNVPSGLGSGQAGIPCGPINNIAEALEHPQVPARNMLIHIDDPAAGRVRLAGNPMKLSAFADPTTREPAPDLDADRAAILRELGL